MDIFDYLVINIVDKDKSGYFIFTKKDLIKQGIVSVNNKKGKMDFRVYPSWENNLNLNANKTKKIQSDYFLKYSID